MTSAPRRRPPLFPAPLIYGTIVAFSIPVFAAVSQALRRPYLDEVFHIPLTQHYIRTLDFAAWDPMITTPPGLYWLATLYSRTVVAPVVDAARALAGTQGTVMGIVGTVAGLDPDGVWVLRSLNLVGVLLVLPLVLDTLHTAQSRLAGTRVKTTTPFAALVTFPLFYFFAFLFYTDVWAAILVLASLAAGKQALSLQVARPGAARPTGSFLTVILILLSAALALVSLTFRQTNVVWAAYTAVSLLETQSTLNRPQPSSLRARLTAVVVTALDLASPVPRTIVFAYSAVGAAFAIFVRVNGGITLGDKSHHQVSANVGQLFYYALHAAFFFGPPAAMHTILRAVSGKVARPSAKKLLAGGAGAVAAVAATVVSLRTFAFAAPLHPHAFLLADNRHYTFYIWRRVLAPARASTAAAAAAAPFFTAGFALLGSGLASAAATVPVTTLAYVAATAATLVPSPLLEPRYYLVPYAVWRACHVCAPEDAEVKKDKKKHKKDKKQDKEDKEDKEEGEEDAVHALLARVSLQDAEFLWNTYVNVLTLFLFLRFPFVWPAHDGLPASLQRFMW